MGSTTVPQQQLAIGEHEARLLRAHIERLQKWNARSVVRIVTQPDWLGIYANPPMGVLSHVQLPLTAPVSTPIDLTLLASDLIANITADSGRYRLDLDPALSVAGTADIAVLPPDDGWQLPIPGVAGDVAPMVDRAIADFRARSQTALDPDALADEIWDQTSFGGLPLRVLHAARLLGLLTADSSRVAAATRTGWKKFTTVRGQVFVRVPGALDRPTLTVVR